MVMSILIPTAVIGAIGLLFGLLLAVASNIFAVNQDERVEKITSSLPSANCGGCGYAGCAAFAAAVVEGKAPITGCPVGGAKCAETIAEIMGKKAGSMEKKVAVVLCNGTEDNATDKYSYSGIDDCAAVSRLASGQKSCKYACVGLGNCVKACKFGAMEIINGVAVVNRERCTACGMCVAACPKDIITLVPYSNKHVVLCSNKDKGVLVKDICKVGCIACGLCVKACEYDAVKVENNLAAINPEKCVNCSACYEKCPKSTIIKFD